MVAQLSQRGFREWLVQRVSALLIGSYAIVVVAYLLSFPNMSYVSWMHLYASTWMRVYTVVTLLAILWHAWIGLWTVFTDYIKSLRLRLFLQTCLVLLLIVYLIWCLYVLWI